MKSSPNQEIAMDRGLETTTVKEKSGLEIGGNLNTTSLNSIIQKRWCIDLTCYKIDEI